MAIQQSINQLLSTAGIAAGLYAHQPNVQQERQRKANYKLADIEAEREMNIITKAFEGNISELSEEAFQELGTHVKSFEEIMDRGIASTKTHEEATELTKLKTGISEEWAKREKEREDIKTAQEQQVLNLRRQEAEAAAAKAQEEEAKRFEVERQKQAEMKAKLDEEQRIKTLRENILNSPVNYSKREVIKYGK